SAISSSRSLRPPDGRPWRAVPGGSNLRAGRADIIEIASSPAAPRNDDCCHCERSEAISSKKGARRGQGLLRLYPDQSAEHGAVRRSDRRSQGASSLAPREAAARLHEPLQRLQARLL